MCEPEHDLPKKAFTQEIADFFRITYDKAEVILRDFLDVMGIDFGNPDFDWCDQAVLEIAAAMSDGEFYLEGE